MSEDLDLSGARLLAALNSSLPKEEKVDPVFCELDRWLARHQCHLEGQVRARAWKYRLAPDEIEVLVQKTLLKAASLLQDQAMDKGGFAFTGKPNFMGYLMCIVRSPRDSRIGTLPELIREIRPKGVQFVDAGEVLDEVVTSAQVNRAYEAEALCTLSQGFAKMTAMERSVAGLYFGLLGADISTPAIAKYLGSCGLEPGKVENVVKRANRMVWKSRRHFTHDTLEELFAIPKITIRRLIASAMTKLDLDLPDAA